MTPSKLHWFLVYAEKKLGVANTCNLEGVLDQKEYGPYILHLVSDKALTDLGISPGNILWLKTGSEKWWNSAKPKQKGCEDDDTSVDLAPPTKKIWYEKCYHDGGEATFWGPALVPDKSRPGSDYTVYYYCKAQGDIFPIPPGYIACEEEENPFSYWIIGTVSL
jgi:hypothetical protein